MVLSRVSDFMRIACKCCGLITEVVQVSPDYNVDNHVAFLAKARTIRFVFENETVDEFLMSPEFINQNGITLDTVPLPDQYPPWVKLVKYECRNCFLTRGKV